MDAKEYHYIEEQILDVVPLDDLGGIPETPALTRGRYISASMCGHECDAFVAYTVRGFRRLPPPANLLRLFQIGEDLEATALRWLKSHAALRDWSISTHELKDKQHSRKQDIFIGYADALLKIPPATNDDAASSLLIVEIKTTRDKYFRAVVNQGAKLAWPKHVDQCHMLMHLFQIELSLLWYVNRETGELYSELVPFDQLRWNYIVARAERIMQDIEVRRQSDQPRMFCCVNCQYHHHCHKKIGAVLEDCRQCKHSIVTSPGEAWCTRHKRQATALCNDGKSWEPLSRAS